MKTLALGFTAGLSLAGVGPALAQEVPPYAGTYYETVTGNCFGVTCQFIFKEVPIINVPYGNGSAVLMASKVNCRIVVSGSSSGTPLAYAALGKSSNADKISILPNSTQGPYLFQTANVYTVYYIDQITQFYVGPGASPMILISTPFGFPVVVPNAALDQPTCSVSGLMQ
jgi:hypothetical protein